MTPRRYNAYRRICTELDLLSPEALADAEKDLLRDVAEGMLLARRGSGEEVEELRSKAAVALSLLVGLGRWSDAAADQMWERLVECGPSEASRIRPARTVEHA